MFIRQYIPVLISALVFAVADMADALVVGNRMGTLGLAAISFAVPVFMIFNVIMHSFGLGGSIDFSKKMAAGKEDDARGSFQGVMTCVLSLGILIAVFGSLFTDGMLFILGVSSQYAELHAAAKTYIRILFISAPFFFFDYCMGYYMRNDDMDKESSICSTTGNIIDLALNIILVLFFNMGVRGAALATFTGVVITSSAEFFFSIKKHSHLKFFPYKPDFSSVPRVFKTGIASCISYIYSFIFIWLGNNAILRLAGEAGVAVFDIVQNISNMMVYIFNADCMATQPIISTYEGECKYDEADRMQMVATNVVFISGIIMTCATFLFAPFICNVFGVYDSAAVEYGSYALRIFSSCMIFAGLNLVISNYYTARNIIFPAFLISTLRGLVIVIPVTLICISLGSRAFWFTYPVNELLTFSAIMFYLKFIYTNSTRGRKESESRIKENRIYKMTLNNDITKVSTVVAEIEQFCEEWEADMKQLYYVQMTVEEVCSAIIQNGFSNSEGDGGLIDITLVAMDDKEFSLHIRDNATSFNPFDMNKKAVHELDDSGSDFNAVGMDVIKKKAKDFYYRRYQGFNTMVVII